MRHFGRRGARLTSFRNQQLALFALLVALAAGEPEAAQSTSYSLLNELDGVADSVLQFGRLANDGFPDSDQLPEGHVCMDKVVEVEETIYDEEMRRVSFNCADCADEGRRKHRKTRAAAIPGGRADSFSTF